MAPKRTAASSNHTTTAPASKRARVDSVNYGELDEDDEQPDPGREDSDNRATLTRATRKKGKEATQQHPWAVKMLDKIEEDKTEMLSTIAQIEQKRGPTARSSSAESAINEQTPVDLDPTSTALLTSCTSLLSLYNSLNTSLASLGTNAFMPGTEVAALPTPASLATSRTDTEKLLLAGFKVAARSIGRSIDPQVNIFTDPKSTDGEENGDVRGDNTDSSSRKDRQGRTKTLVVDGRLVTVLDHDTDSTGKENNPPAPSADNETGRARNIRDVTAEDEARWTATLLSHGQAEGEDQPPDEDENGEVVAMTTWLRDVEKGAKRMLKHCTREMEEEQVF
ncbi:hypothetical protein BDZ85DRAFT_277332 [Elsinoe ampelina]|uniref:Uncharacterized protein n=1 Tax=Elsinoe ampelina TaxID=302913 RepID=A0A6A6GP77_9PEZI|nr:hypothetical protein BDZ85DRAFT_277332 [Elsinoe ampelina]